MTIEAPQTAMARRCLSVLALSVGLALAGCGGGQTPTTFDLTAPSGFGRVGGSHATMVVARPTAVQALDSDRVIVKDSGGALSFLGGAQWADQVPALVQTRLIQTFENASRIGSVSAPGQGITPTVQLVTDIRSFNIDAASGSAVVEITAKIVGDTSGRIQRAKLFSARVPAAAVDGPGAAQALDRALSQVLVDIVRWAR
ncbi:membrane integrity-associated transporter subunit PqiC [Bosea sp. SSUT16]|jgi:cholesterol transport system auxiliary component|uniref:Membrane integrity-associated transporter subunit PqiC n=1 Tax=Bosea spartocytisi TaxID=2773451 RepID=A0A927E4C8_9HYPH|nr:ABC-type transport auxiliary lipoprotein family protein [Bosea spartocytisi]MBD3844593.1 membrane integrity-associated transporter subunit PqiC [Bosea spartocytisi]MCT4470300.1 ABC-type transport auxiliary lipoprotein family protein [Bosea spartocytisi]